MARMPKKRFALDPRLLIGVALVVASVAGVWGIVAAADETVLVFVASGHLSPGDRIDESNLDTRSVRLDAATDLYLAPGSIPSDGLVMTHHVGDGELVPVSATGSTDGLLLTSLVLSLDGQLAASVAPGSSVDVWASRETESGVFAAPATIVTDASVVRLVASESIVGAGETTAVEVLVPRSKVARVLEAIANDDAISVVPASLPGFDT